jgi:hypothetical protein
MFQNGGAMDAERRGQRWHGLTRQVPLGQLDQLGFLKPPLPLE